MKTAPVRFAQYRVALLAIFIISITACNKNEDFTLPGEPKNNRPPVAVAGPDQFLLLPDSNAITLDGNKSKDPDGGDIHLSWLQIKGPVPGRSDDAVGKLVLSFKDTGTYVFLLKAADPWGKEGTDTVNVTVRLASYCNLNPVFRPLTIENTSMVSDTVLSNASVALVDHYFVFAGGNTSIEEDAWWGGGINASPGVYTGQLTIYDITSNSWKNHTLPDSTQGSAVAGANGKIFVAGGSNRTGFSSSIQIFDIATGTFTIKKMSQPTTGMVAAAVGDKLIFAGGLHYDQEYSDIVYMYDIPSGTWTNPHLNEGRLGMAVAVSGNKLFLAGGKNANNNLQSRTVDIFDASTGQWSVYRLQKERNEILAGVAGNSLVISGSGKALEIVDINNLTSTYNCVFPVNNVSNTVLGTAQLHNTIYYSNSELLDAYDPQAKSWTFSYLSGEVQRIFNYKDELYGLGFTYFEEYRSGYGWYQLKKIKF